jgi:ABC-type multidrug transport system fused ATPase/permease subunit
VLLLEHTAATACCKALTAVLHYALHIRYMIVTVAGCMHLGAHASLVAVMAIGGSQVVAGTLSIGEMSSFLLYSSLMAFNFGGLSSVYSDVMRALGASDRIMDIIRSGQQANVTHHCNGSLVQLFHNCFITVL